MWQYVISTGELLHNLIHVANGYSGFPPGKNNPDMQNVRAIGPIPCGLYTIGNARDTVDHGPYVMPLTPDAANQMYGRAGFLLHGDSSEHMGLASHGCIIQRRDIRYQVGTSGDNRLTVVARPEDLAGSATTGVTDVAS